VLGSTLIAERHVVELEQQIGRQRAVLDQLVSAGRSEREIDLTGIVTLISGRWRRSHLVDAPHHATHQAHVSCRQTLNASDRIAR
jgi:hypothetical protein